MNEEENSSPKIPPLYHYTTQNGLLGIIDSKSLWFTYIFYLNDASEFKYTFDLVEEELDLRKITYSHEFMKKSLLKATLLLEEIKKMVAFYVFSFSAIKDQLSQWRGYCGNEVGYCVQFDSDKIFNFIGREHFKIKECLYKEELQRDIIRKIIEKSFEDLKEIGNITVKNSSRLSGSFSFFGEAVPKEPTMDEIKIIEKVQNDFILEVSSNVAVFKHPKFFEEEEWRIFAVFDKIKDRQVKFRSDKSMLIPYKEIQIAESSEKLPIKRIIVGPTNHPELAKGAVEDLLLANSIQCEVELSEIPYRD